MPNPRPVPEPPPVTLPPAAQPGSARYFALLYTPAARRGSLARLLGLGDEIGAGVARGLDHEVAHARLDWWRHEAGQYAAGHAQHPWLRALPGDPDCAEHFELQELVQAAALDLAQGLQGSATGERLRGAVFALAAQVLGAGHLSPALREALGALGALTWQLERAASPAKRAAAASALPAVLGRFGPALQPKLAPLLIWAALAARPKSASRWQVFADNIRAWSLARRAAAGSFSQR
jgi:hypothetical protein